MSQVRIFVRFSGLRVRALAFGWAAIGTLVPALVVHAEQFDIPGPLGSVAFGQLVVALPNGNFVVTDPEWDSAAGAVYLYSADRVLISTLTGSTANDRISAGNEGDGIVVVGDSNFVVTSPQWFNGDGDIDSAGAVTWVNGVTGLTAAVSSDNSLVGTTAFSSVGSAGVVVLNNGNYVVLSPNWSNSAGAATWGSGASGVSGPVSIDNSLIGTMDNDSVGQRMTTLTNGNYVVLTRNWNNGTGAATWGSGISGAKGAVSIDNSLIGTTVDDNVGYSATALSNGNYVVLSPQWNSGAGAATWADGSTGLVGTVSTGNSLYGTTVVDAVGNGQPGAVALSNGNYVVSSPDWYGGAAAGTGKGAATWGNGDGGTIGAVSDTNSLIGSVLDDRVGARITALSNGNYVVASPSWHKGGANCMDCGAVTWGDGSAGTKGAVSTGNSLFGTTAGDRVGGFGATALSNGNYVVASPDWNNDVEGSSFGAATWGDGGAGITGAVSDTNSLIGITAGDRVGFRVVALSNGNYVVVTPSWDNGPAGVNFGAVTWSNGTSGVTGAVSAGNSLTGSSVDDRIGGGKGGLIALQNGNYVVPSPTWNGGVGASTWANGSTGLTGIVSAANSLIGSAIDDAIGSGRGESYSDSNYIVVTPQWNSAFGAVTLGSGAFRLKGTIQPWNSVTGGIMGGLLAPSYSPSSKKLVVGRPLENIVSVFTMDQVFAGDIEL